MLIVAMSVQAFGFVGSAGANKAPAYDFVQVLAASVTRMPVGENDRIQNVQLNNFRIGKTEVTYDLWYRVRTWAEKRGWNRYFFQNAGQEGHDGVDGAAPTNARNQPVTEVSWRDVVVWTNAYSEMAGLTPVYRAAGKSDTILRDSRDAQAKAVDGTRIFNGANGYRLPTSLEWEMAARWLGTSATIPNVGAVKSPVKTQEGKVTYFWTPGSYASGAINGTVNEYKRVSWAWTGNQGTKNAGKKAKNKLGMRDVNGNVREWAIDIKDGRVLAIRRGGNYIDGSTYNNVSYVHPHAPAYTLNNVGFRLARNGK
jgi:formylglycine-generating enzyme required for sulfatase activity